MKQIIDLPCKDKLDNSIAFICRFREWLGEGHDILIWRKNTKLVCHYFESRMGETFDKDLTPKIMANKYTSSKLFNKFLKDLEHNGILEFQMDENPRIMNNYNDYYFIRLEDGRSHCFHLLHGYHGDPRFTEIKNLIYRAQKRLIRL